MEHIIGKLEVTPADRVKHIVEYKPPDLKEVGPCGGFSAQYLCMCDYYNLPFREEVAWDVDTIYYSHDSHELCLQDFEHLDHRDLTCISKFFFNDFIVAFYGFILVHCLGNYVLKVRKTQIIAHSKNIS